MNQAVAVDWRGRRTSIEFGWVGASGARAPLLVFLHEGLGSLAMWKDFPAQLCDRVGARGLVYSRPGYGRSTPRAAGEALGTDYLHRQADEVLPALLDALDVAQPAWLFGHSDGGSIALLAAGRHPARVAGLVLLAPHIFVEDLSVASIAQARDAYPNGKLRGRLARYHDAPDAVFRAWNDVWLSPAFRRWNITDELADIRCPVLAIQGLDDAYGTLAQIRGIAERVGATELLELPDCGHSAYRDQPEQVIAATNAFIHHRRQR
ncbi:alpha/beta fold hydrolase [Pseudorhodoferax sp.]|uniref:alpha/beta fold hydrolase n=1 Tax=Pseudorhodoferax sp. TaxID=1993553 RepID=UPI002DD66575|nr:alpha/beta fold hydrolase [Pseudorhodoferax sp.]